MTTNGLTEDWNNPGSVQRSKRASLIGIQSADFIKASGYVPRKQAGHMEATDQSRSDRQKNLAYGGHPHMDTTHVCYHFRELNSCARAHSLLMTRASAYRASL
jgi:hypothetical protein